MKNTIVVVPPVGSACEATIDMKTESIRNFLSFSDLQSEMISLKQRPVMVYYDGGQKTYGKNFIASCILGKTINGNCIVRLVGGNITHDELIDLVGK